MAARPVWRGHLRLALVSCPVALHTVQRASGDLRFHLINPETGHRIRMATLDAETEQELSRRDLVKGYEFEKNRYLLLDDSDFEQARIESSSVLVISKFLEYQAISPIYFDASYYVLPDGDTGQDVYVVLRDAIARSKMVALSRVVIGRRERAVAILPMGKGLVCHTLHEPQDLYQSDAVFADIEDAKPDAEMVKLAIQLIDRQQGKLEPADTEDRYEARLREVIQAKLAGEGIEPESVEEPDRDNVIDLMAALKASLRGERADAKAAPARTSAPARRSQAPKKAAGKTASRKTAAPSRRKRA